MKIAIVGAAGRMGKKLIELAQDASLNGDSDKAIENYRLALGELDRVEAEYPARAESSEFAPLRLRRRTAYRQAFYGGRRVPVHSQHRFCHRAV